MKRIALFILCFTLLLGAVACGQDKPAVTESGTEGATEGATEIVTDNDSETESDDTSGLELKDSGIIACNGVFHNSKVKYAIDADNKLILYIEDWNESFIVPNEDMNVIAETLSSSSVVVLEDQGLFFFRDFSQSPKPIKVIRFTKGNPQVSVDDLSFRTSESYSYKYCNFIDDQTGYLFLFSGASGSSFELSDLLKTTNGGETWYPQELEKVPSIYWKSDLLCAKMLDETVGFCSGQHYADDNMSARTYITADGGKTWEQVVLPKDGPYVDAPDSSETITYMACIEAYDLLYEDGQYVLCFKTRSADADEYFQYASTDLKTWTFVE